MNREPGRSLEGTLFDGRGFFGIGADGGMIKSEQTDDASLRDLMLDRDSDETGTSALVIGFHDPPEPPEATIDDLADGLRAGIEQNFWPLITRGRVEITVTKIDGDVVTPVFSRPAQNLRRPVSGSTVARWRRRELGLGRARRRHCQAPHNPGAPPNFESDTPLIRTRSETRDHLFG